MSQQLSKHFEPKQVEDKWNLHWRETALFSSYPDERKPFTIVIPPPNVTGVLHMGHTLNETVQDILIRRARMSGFNACWVPGSDHASIATEAKVVKMLEEDHKISKKDLSREQFLKYAFEWKEKYGNIIYNQIERLGCSVDWNRVSFTMDDHYYQSVIKVFVDLYDKGLIYRGARMINWDPLAKTALSDEEVEYREITGRLYYIKYRIAGSEEFLTIATQRPETIMGDTGVALNPNDDRYSHLKNKKIIIPLINREVPIVFDDYVDPAFGTGALKITPAHDINDYNLGLKHKLEVIDTLNEDGTLNEAAQIFIGKDRFEARKLVVEKLAAVGALIREEEYITRLGFSQRTNAVVEPRISTQWFVSMKHFATHALSAVEKGQVRIFPEEKFIATYRYWLENVKDWCISRQLWWGQRIPAWYAPNGNYAVAENINDAYQKLIYRWSSEKDQTGALSSDIPFKIEDIRQDEDVFDTWFSSWIWPIEVFRGISNPGNPDIKYYYPTTVLVTGQDIMFFWVARMIMAGKEFMNEKPFSDVYFTGMVRDKQGRKMSKSLGNSPDLLDLIDRYGADAVRFGIMIASPAGNDLLFDEGALEQGRNFNNKIWNALKLVLIWGERQETDEAKNKIEPETQFANDWFRNRLNNAKIELEKLYRDYKLSECLKLIYSLIWDDFCSWYLEWIKPAPESKIKVSQYEETVFFFEELISILHPFMPFITEEIYSHLKTRKDSDVLSIRQSLPAKESDKKIIDKGEFLKLMITTVRDLRTRQQAKPKDSIEIIIDTDSREKYRDIIFIISKQLNASGIIFDRAQQPGAITTIIRNDKIYLHFPGNTDASGQKEQLLKDLEYLKGFLDSVQKKLNNERFVSNAKPEVVEIEKRKKADAEAKIRAIEESLMSLN